MVKSKIFKFLRFALILPFSLAVYILVLFVAGIMHDMFFQSMLSSIFFQFVAVVAGSYLFVKSGKLIAPSYSFKLGLLLSISIILINIISFVFTRVNNVFNPYLEIFAFVCRLCAVLAALYAARDVLFELKKNLNPPVFSNSLPHNFFND